MSERLQIISLDNDDGPVSICGLIHPDTRKLLGMCLEDGQSYEILHETPVLYKFTNGTDDCEYLVKKISGKICISAVDVFFVDGIFTHMNSDNILQTKKFINCEISLRIFEDDQVQCVSQVKSGLFQTILRLLQPSP